MEIPCISYMNLSSEQFWCNFQSIKMDVPLKLWEAITTDGGQHPFLTRFFHNKPYFYFTSFLRCCLSIFDPLYLLILVLLGVFSLWRKKVKK